MDINSTPPVNQANENCDKYKQTITELHIDNRKCLDGNYGKYIYSVFHVMMSIAAIYLSIRCNKGINTPSLITAFFFPYIYIIYSIITNQGICEKL